MSIKARTAAVITGALAATTITGVAAFASPLTGPATAGMDAQPMHMEQMSEATMGEMADLMAEDVTVGEMHQWMADNGIPIGAMHREMARGGSNPGAMHRSMAAPTR
ncbi:hypothetical protein [Euzebya sp.]|uniref:hypothetical protein n=1 Tax=Euzebya sp. TaxID=1971409 RepID=UPI003513DDCA